MQFLRSKKVLLLLSGALLLLIIIPFAFFVLSRYTKTTQVKKVTEDIGKTSQKYGSFFNQDQVKEALATINNTKLSASERYKALDNITFYFSSAYAASHDPTIREYVLSLKDFAKKNFPKDYREGAFNLACGDPVCGEKPDAELKQIQKEINEAGIDADHLNTIKKNLEQASYIPVSEEDDKKYGFGLVLSQLDEQNNPKASAAAVRLKDYLRKKYLFEFTQPAQ